MFKAEIDKSANLLKVGYSRQVSPHELEQCAAQVEQLLPMLRPGFRLLTDLSALEGMDLDCVPYIKRMMDACNRSGVELVVRIIPDPHKDIGLKIMSLFHYRRRVRIITCTTLAEGLEVLAR